MADTLRLPKILVIDELLAEDHGLRATLCQTAGLLDMANSGINTDTIKPIAAAWFSPGQIRQGDTTVNDRGTIHKAIEGQYGIAPADWSLILLNAHFHPWLADNTRAPYKPGEKMFGMEIRTELLERHQGLPVVMFTTWQKSNLTGADNPSKQLPYFAKLKADQRTLTEVLLQHGRLGPEQMHGLLQLSEHGYVAQSQAMLDVFRQAYVHADDGCPILLVGPTGVGKEVVANYVHRVSPRHAKPFRAVNVTEPVSTLIESELFGHEKGAFTGAAKKRLGQFELAHHGTLFLDEIGDLALDIQAKLLRVIQEKEIRPVGADKTVQVDFQLICATNHDLNALRWQGRFRDDLLWRIGHIPIRIPPLKERTEDILPLALKILQEYQQSQQKEGIEFSQEAVAQLIEHPFPGNVRELQNIVARLVGRTGSYDIIEAHDIKQVIANSIVQPQPTAEEQTTPAKELRLEDLPELMASLHIATGDAPRGVIKKLDNELRDLMARVVGMQLDISRDGTGRSRMQTALRHLWDDNKITGGYTKRMLKKIVGPEVDSENIEEASAELVKKWQDHSNDNRR